MEKNRKEQTPRPGKKSVLSDKDEFKKDEGKDEISHMGDEDTGGTGQGNSTSRPSERKPGEPGRS